MPVVETEAATTTEEIWAKLKTGLLKTTEEVCGTTKPHRWRRETWWWNKEVDDAITGQMHTSIILHCLAHLQTCGAPCTPRSRKGGL